jgi:hypothetical protein
VVFSVPPEKCHDTAIYPNILFYYNQLNAQIVHLVGYDKRVYQTMHEMNSNHIKYTPKV